jgi:hypothetical protein
MATAVLDRLLHHATTINIRGDSYRMKERRKAGLHSSLESREADLGGTGGSGGNGGAVAAKNGT